MNDAYIFIGSNIDRDTNYVAAVKRLRELGKLVAVSPVYDTPAIGSDPNAPRFYNGAVWLDTELAPHALRNALRKIEGEMGRVRTADKYAPRPIDLDLVLYGEVALDDGELKIPDPLIFERGFMARALAHLNPDYVIPPDGPTLAELACRLRSKNGELIEQVQVSEQVKQFATESVKERASMSKSGGNSHSKQDKWETPISQIEHAPALSEEHATPTSDAAHHAIEEAVRTILLNVGEDPNRDGLLKTPDRVARAYDELLGGYRMDAVKVVNGAFFDADYHDIVLVKDIEFYSMCEHHLLPFFGKVDVAYIPGAQVIGLSKIPRLVEMYARRLQLQERMTHDIAECLEEMLHPRGVAVIVTGQHMCSMMRGVKKQQSKMVTQVLTGDFQDHDIRAQLNDLLHQED